VLLEGFVQEEAGEENEKQTRHQDLCNWKKKKKNVTGDERKKLSWVRDFASPPRKTIPSRVKMKEKM